MAHHLYIAEKPSLAEAIAKALADINKTTATKSGGAWKVGDDEVCWLFGQMYELREAKEYDELCQKWSLDDLPIIPDKWKMKVIEDKNWRIHIRCRPGDSRSRSHS
ncbi:hypothetical protein AYJ57_21720 (plasmid) [Salipiger sp. CCB-MM3]|uniref:hypothetical protein n=1 Tax=Salipiger sp. CCB-MM3 TaxID=1792508 RepID=UPI00080A9F68|nr:hypothetical protein [Salipiger sp. CCB-MM3]ANT63092.1 hypothetical protein AYJ57_21720 [Salipiger sp. CCB-MM3]